MADIPEQTNAAARHQVYLEGVKTRTEKDYDPFLVAMAADIRKTLSGTNVTEWNKRRLNAQLKSLTGKLSKSYDGWQEELTGQIGDIAVYEAGFEERSLNRVVDYEFNTPAAAQITAAVASAPLSVEGADNGKLLKPFFKGYKQKTIDRVEGAIRQGFAQGQTNRQIQQKIIGTRAKKYRDGIMGISKREANLVVRTSIQHASAHSREVFFNANDDVIKGVKWVSTLDSGTTSQCRTLDGQVFKINKGPRPPIHIGCRSTIVPEVSSELDFLSKGATRPTRGSDGVELVPQSKSYYEWLKVQDKDFVDSVIGPTRSKLLLNGGISANRFAELQLNKQFKPITLAEMELLEPLAFKRAGI